MKDMHLDEQAVGGRFEFGKNWKRFLAVVNDQRIRLAENSLCEMLGVEELGGNTFLDVGSGSGLFSVAARRMGAVVHSFEYDPLSVACAMQLKQRYCPQDDGWTIQQGSILDSSWTRSLGAFDVVYSWGVLHHTGAMWRGL